MRTSSPAQAAGNTRYAEEKSPLYTAFSMASKRPANDKSADKEEDSLFEGAD